MSATDSGYQQRPMLFGKYCLLERISVGGMAEVFRARPFHAPDVDKYLALKRILPHLAEDDDFLKMFVDEAKLCVHLRHPNVVRVFELGRFQSSPYILMEFISGQDLLALQKRLRRERLIMSVAQACYVVKELAKGLDYAHKAVDDEGRPLHIIHRDVSPQNILIDYNGAVKLIDFGVAKATVQSTKTQVGVLKGKFGYMSPEQIRGEQIDHRSDIFACGTVLWELLTNRRLFTGDSEFEVFQKVKEARVDPPSKKNPQVPARVDEIVMKALSSQPATRYQTCGELVQDLQAFLFSIQPLYTQAHLSQWMARFFGEELEEVDQKVERFRQIRTPEDVRREVVGESGIANPSPDGSAEGATRIWDADIEPGQDQDLDAFVAQHTIVQAGGLDLEEFATLGEDELLSIEDAPQVVQEQPAASHPLSNLGMTPQLGAPSPMSRTGVHRHVTQELTSPGAMVTMTGMPPSAEDASLLFDRERIDRATKRRNQRAIAAVVAMIACVGLAGATVVVWLGRGEAAESAGDATAVAPAQTTGTLVVTSSPAEGVEILVNGDARATSAPLTLRDVEPGSHFIVIRRDGYESFEATVTVGAGALVPVDAVLEPR